MTTRINVRHFADRPFATLRQRVARSPEVRGGNRSQTSKTLDHLRKHRHKGTRTRCHG